MGKDTAIEWCDHTFNPWTGCAKVSPACDHCYAESWAKRSGHVIWGTNKERRRTKTWGDPVKWDKQAADAGERRRVFCASLADVFDNNKSILPQWRTDLGALINATPNLDWLLLTKRIGNADRYLADMFPKGIAHQNLWLGITICNEEEADRYIPKLLKVKSAFDLPVAFLSCEPLLGPLEILGYLLSLGTLLPKTNQFDVIVDAPRIDWVICGGESGSRARPMHPDWARSLKDQCERCEIPFLFKQWGVWQPIDEHWPDVTKNRIIRQGEQYYVDVGKKRAGRLLDGVESNGFPKVDRK